MTEHPAKFSDPIIFRLQEICDEYCAHIYDAGEIPTVLDPFAGTGKIHSLRGVTTIGVELEPEWAEMHPCTEVGDATALRFTDHVLDAVITSPTYGNRMADHHVARDDSKRHTYTHAIGRSLHNNNSGAMQWGCDYRDFHRKAWREAIRVVKEDGLLVINISNHIRKGVEQHVVEFHIKALIEEGCRIEEVRRVATRRQKHGANGSARVDSEKIIIARTPTGEPT